MFARKQPILARLNVRDVSKLISMVSVTPPKVVPNKGRTASGQGVAAPVVREINPMTATFAVVGHDQDLLERTKPMTIQYENEDGPYVLEIEFTGIQFDPPEPQPYVHRGEDSQRVVHTLRVLKYTEIRDGETEWDIDVMNDPVKVHHRGQDYFTGEVVEDD